MELKDVLQSVWND